LWISLGSQVVHHKEKLEVILSALLKESQKSHLHVLIIIITIIISWEHSVIVWRTTTGSIIYIKRIQYKYVALIVSHKRSIRILAKVYTPIDFLATASFKINREGDIQFIVSS